MKVQTTIFNENLIFFLSGSPCMYLKSILPLPRRGELLSENYFLGKLFEIVLPNAYWKGKGVVNAWYCRYWESHKHELIS